MNGGSLSQTDWHNLYETVFQEHRGEKEYTDKLEEQITLFQVNVYSLMYKLDAEIFESNFRSLKEVTREIYI